MAEKRLTYERRITVFPGMISRDDREVQYQTQKLRDQGCTHIEYEQVDDFNAKLTGWMVAQ